MPLRRGGTAILGAYRGWICSRRGVDLSSPVFTCHLAGFVTVTNQCLALRMRRALRPNACESRATASGFRAFAGRIRRELAQFTNEGIESARNEERQRASGRGPGIAKRVRNTTRQHCHRSGLGREFLRSASNLKNSLQDVVELVPTLMYVQRNSFPGSSSDLERARGSAGGGATHPATKAGNQAALAGPNEDGFWRSFQGRDGEPTPIPAS